MFSSRTHAFRQGRRLRRDLAGVAALAMLAVGLSACQSDTSPRAAGGSAVPDGSTSSAQPAKPAKVRVRSDVGGDATAVPVDHQVKVSARGGTLNSVTVSSKAGPVAGKLSPGDQHWVASGRLEPGTDYDVRTVAQRSDGHQVTRTSAFRTQDLTLAEQTYASVAPLDGETVGVGMPVIVKFDVAVTDRAAIEKHMSVTSSPAQAGSWHWISAHEVHWRPKSYWKAGSDVSVDVDINSVAAGPDLYGQESRHVDFHVGDANVYKVDLKTDQMRVFQNGSLLRTIPVTGGKAGYTTRSGTKVIVEKFASKRMNSETVGIPANSPDAYDIDDVQWAMRLTYSGEFLHAAPWSVGSQGSANVSHGCTGMSTADAKWLFDMSRRGDVVQFTGTDRPMTLTNGYGDWNESFAQYRAGSATS